MYITFQLGVSHCSDTNIAEECAHMVQHIPSYQTCSLLTRHGKAAQCTGLSLGLTHPFFTALSRHLDPAWHRAVRSWKHHVHIAAWHTGNLAITAHTLVLTAGEEGLAALIDRTVQNTHISHMSWRKETERTGLNGFNLFFQMKNLSFTSNN